MTKNCPRCGYPNPDDALFCQRCGYQFTPYHPKNSSSKIIVGAVGGIIAIVVAVLAVFLVMYHSGGVAITPQGGTLCYYPFNDELIANIILNSTGKITMTSASIRGTSIYSTNITPNTLLPGENVVIITFNSVTQQELGNLPSYTIILTLGNGEQISVAANLEEYFGTPTVTQVGTGTMCTLPNGTVKAVFDLHSTGNVQIVSSSIVGTELQGIGSEIPLKPGINQVTIYFPNTSGNTFQPDATYQLSLGLSDGTTVQVAVTYVGKC
ncbi:MAG: DUF973 family protein [Sulfolobaceae archaeon]